MTAKRFVTLGVLMVVVIAMACGASRETSTPFVPSPTAVLAGPSSTHLPTATPEPTATSDSPRRANSVPLGGGRSAPILRTGPRDVIPAIFDPVHIAADEVGDQVGEFSRVIGVSIGGESLAYSVAHLSGHEIVNDTVGGTPIAVTW